MHSLFPFTYFILIAFVGISSPQLCPFIHIRPPVTQPSPPSYAACALLLNEVFIPNGPLCQQTCANLFQCCFIPDGPAWQSCHCMPGTARSRRGDCIPVASQECINEIRDRSVVCRI